MYNRRIKENNPEAFAREKKKKLHQCHPFWENWEKESVFDKKVRKTKFILIISSIHVFQSVCSKICLKKFVQKVCSKMLDKDKFVQIYLLSH
jgi:hypothetical protein